MSMRLPMTRLWAGTRSCSPRKFADLAEVSEAQRALDVGCGTGTLTGELVDRLGASSVSAVDPSAPFVASVRDRYPEVDVQRANAELLPFADDSFDVALAQLVVHFMSDPAAGLAEMARVTRADGVVGACVWDHAGGQGPLTAFWNAARDLDPLVEDESLLAGTRAGDLTALLAAPGCARSKRCLFPSKWSTRASRSGGSRSRWVSARRAHTSPASPTTNKLLFVSGVAGQCRRPRSS